MATTSHDEGVNDKDVDGSDEEFVAAAEHDSMRQVR
jgi:hypothetical protein